MTSRGLLVAALCRNSNSHDGSGGEPSLRGAKRRSNPFFLYAARWIASRSLSSGARSRDPVARNDGPGAKKNQPPPSALPCSLRYRRFHEPRRIGAEFAHDLVMIRLFDGYRLQPIL